MGLIKALKPLKHPQEAEATGKKPQRWKGRGGGFEGLTKISEQSEHGKWQRYHRNRFHCQLLSQM